MTADTLDPLIHVPARLWIVATLAALPDGDALSFTRLLDMIGLTPGMGGQAASTRARQNISLRSGAERRALPRRSDTLRSGAPWSRALKFTVEHLAGGPHERVSLDVLAVAALLADQHHGRVACALAHHGLGGALVQVASAAFPHGRTEARERRPVGDRGRRSIVHCPGCIPVV